MSLCTPQERFIKKIIKNKNGCWVWQATKNKLGYGVFFVEKKLMLAHRYSYTSRKGEIPRGLQIDHLCRNSSCVNPDHLEAVTLRENLMRSPIAPAAINSRKKHCPQGHKYNFKNTYRSGNRRWCKICTIAKVKKYHMKKKNYV